MRDAAEFARLRRVTPAEAVAYLQGKGIMATTTNWQDFWHEEHAQAFTISRLTRLDILQSLYDGLVKSAQGDLSRRDWHTNAKELLQQTGWWGKNAITDTDTGEQVFTTFNPSRLQLIYDINIGQAAAAGQWQRLQAAKRTHPYARYITKRDERVREAHRHWDNLVLPVDHPFWQTHWPPNGFRCRCRVVGVSQREYDRGYIEHRAPYSYIPDPDNPGKKKAVIPPVDRMPMKKEAPDEVLRRYTNPRTGEITKLPVGIDPGFAYNAGVARQQALAGLVRDKIVATEASLGAAFWAEASGVLEPMLETQWRETAQQAVRSGRAAGSTHLLGVIDQTTQHALGERGITLASAAILIRDRELLHALRNVKNERGAALPSFVWENLPRLLKSAAIYLDKKDNALMYVIELPERAGKVVVRMNYAEKGRLGGERVNIVANFVRTGGVVDKDNPLEARYERLKK